MNVGGGGSMNGGPTDSTALVSGSRDVAVRIIWLALSILTLIINLDGGGVPAALNNIQFTFQLQPSELGLLGTLVYVGKAVTCLYAGVLLRSLSPLRVCQCSLLINTGFTTWFALAQSSEMLLTTRFFIGFTQATLAVYFPVWVDEFSPRASRTKWMGAIQAGAPLGIMFGFVLSGVSSTNQTDTFGWRVPFIVQSGALLCFAAASLFVPRALFDVGVADGAAE